MASARPRERASPSPMPGGPCRSPERWKGRKARSRSSGGSPGPWSMTRMCTRSAWALAATVGGESAWGELQGVGQQVGQDALKQGWVGHDLGQVVGQLDLDGIGGAAELVDGQRDDFGDARRLRVYAERAGLQAAHVEQVLDQPGEQVQGLVGGGEELLPVALVEHHIRGAQAPGRRPSRRPGGARRSWLTARRSAVRSLSASAIGIAAAACSARRCCRSARAAWTAKASTMRWSEASRVLPLSTRRERVVDGHLDVALPGCRADGGADALGDGPPVGVATFGRRLGCVWVPLEESDRVQCEGLAQLVEKRRQGAGSAQHAAGDHGQRVGLAAGRAACWVRRTARLTVALTVTATRRNTASAKTFWVSAMVQVRTGGVKKKLSSSELTTAAASAAQSRPTSEIATTATRKIRIRLDSDRSSRNGVSTRASAGIRTAVSPSPSSSRPSDSSRFQGLDRRSRGRSALLVGDQVDVDRTRTRRRW